MQRMFNLEFQTVISLPLFERIKSKQSTTCQGFSSSLFKINFHKKKKKKKIKKLWQTNKAEIQIERKERVRERKRVRVRKYKNSVVVEVFCLSINLI